MDEGMARIRELGRFSPLGGGNTHLNRLNASVENAFEFIRFDKHGLHEVAAIG
jgi:hypothetical protein